MGSMRDTYKQMRENAVEARLNAKDVRKKMQGVYTFLHLSQTLLADPNIPPTLSTLQHMIGNIDVEDIRNIIEASIEKKISKAMLKGIE